MDIYQLRAFITVAHEKNLTRASEILYLSQPAVSGQIKMLEEEFGLKLFDRTSRGMELTRIGELLFEKAERIVTAYNDMLDSAKSLGSEVTGKIIIGNAGDPGVLRIGEFMRSVANNYPNIELNFRQRNSGTVINEVRNGKLDAGFVFGGEDNGEIRLLGLKKIRIYLAGPATWKEKLVKARLDEILALPWIWPASASSCNTLAAKLFKERGKKPVKAVESDSGNTTGTLIAAGIGVGLLHEDTALRAQESGEVFLINKMKWQVEVNFIYLRKRENDPLISVLVSILKKLWSI